MKRVDGNGRPLYSFAFDGSTPEIACALEAGAWREEGQELETGSWKLGV